MTGHESPVRRLVHLAVPSNLRDPIGLTVRLIRSGAHGRFAMVVAAMNLLATPLDLVLSLRERSLCRRADAPRLPIALICGPPRSGTTLVANAVARATPVAYFTNVTAVFPRAPITASRLLRARPRNETLTLSSHYGRTSGLRGWNDGLYLWDRWLGRDRQSVCNRIGSQRGMEMSRFFGAFEQWTGLPLVNKNNALNAQAALVSDFLPTATFICLEREPLYLAQSLLLARAHIHGDEMIPYGLSDSSAAAAADPVSDVCRQVRFHERVARQQAARLGPDRFRFLSYEDFCRDPRKEIRAIARDILHTPVDDGKIPASLPPSCAQRVPDQVFRGLRRGLDEGDGP